MRNLLEHNFRPIAVLASFFIMVTIVVTLANLDSVMPDKGKAAPKSQPKISIESCVSETASADETLTCEIKVSLDSTEGAAEIVAVESVLNSFAGASFDLIDAKPNFESTEQIPYGGGLKIKWGYFQMIGGDNLNIKLRLRPKNSGTITSIASAKAPGVSKVSSNNSMTLVKGSALPDGLASAQTSPTVLAQVLQPKTENQTSENQSAITRNRITTQNDRSIIAITPTEPTLGKKSTTTSTTISKPKTVKKKTTPTSKTTIQPKPSTQTTKKVPPKPALKVTNAGSTSSQSAGLMTRADFVAALIRALGADKAGAEPFVDVSENDWFYAAVATAYNLDLIDDVSSHMFRPQDTITREDAAVIIVKAAKVPIETHDSAAINSVLNGFADDALISAWARPFVAASVKNDLLGGYPEGFYKPQVPIAEAEALAALSRLKPIN